MKRVIICAVAIIVIAACSSGEFGATGKAFNEGKYKVMFRDNTGCIFANKDRKYGYAMDGKIVFSPVFDNMEKPFKMKDGSVYLIVYKNGKGGVIKAFEKKYHVPCEYDEVIIHTYPNLLILGKKDNNGEIISRETLRLTTLEIVVPVED